MTQQRQTNLALLAAIISANCLLIFVFGKVILTRDVYYVSFQSQLDNFRIDDLFNLKTRYAWIGYLFVPLFLLLKLFIVALCLQTGLLLNEFKIKFSKTFGIALTAEFVFLLPQLMKLAWFLIIKTDYTLTDVQLFYPFSVLNFFNIADLPALLIYPFQTFNIFEVLYWILLAGGIKEALDTDINQGIKVVFSGYIPALVLWIICIMFITVSLSPAT